MIHFSEKSWHLNFTDRSPKMWELPQITILRTNSKIVGTHTFFLILLRRTYIIWNSSKTHLFFSQFNFTSSTKFWTSSCF
ncbi:hypothetical protein LIL_13077 [Leptospira interrogans serovar Linhai str. 56609]|nr:hypothetical protein LIL_13077 [Leptospira interrogans serovar Linhai str. 56609]